jgi:hypothetical protein
MKKVVLAILFFSSLIFSQKTLLPVLDPDTAVLNVIQNLAPNQGAYLDSFTCVDMYGGAGLAVFSTFATRGPGIRNWCHKWTYAPSRQRALYCGANHGVPHKFNDVWEYDLASNTWAMLHKPDPGAVPCHTWWGMAYDSKRDTLWWVSPGGCGPWIGWFVYDPYAQEGWAEKSFSNTAPNITFSAAFDYNPERDLFTWYSTATTGSIGMWSLDPADWSFTQLLDQGVRLRPTSGCDSCPQAEQITAYEDFYREGPFQIRDRFGGIDYDPDNKVHLAYHHPEDGVGPDELWAYYAPQDYLVKMVPAGDVPSGNAMMFYHRELKVFVLYFHDSPNIYVYKSIPYDSAALEAGAAGLAEARLSVEACPNPFKTAVKLAVSRQRTTDNNIGIAIYNIKGKMVHRLSGNSYQLSAGITWDASRYPAGIYLVKARAGIRTFTKKITLIR